MILSLFLALFLHAKPIDCNDYCPRVDLVRWNKNLKRCECTFYIDPSPIPILSGYVSSESAPEPEAPKVETPHKEWWQD